MSNIFVRSWSRTRLATLREKQGITGPNYCLGACKFFIGKLAGIFDETKYWNDFMNSPWAAKNRGRIDLIAAWGLFRGSTDFNSKVLPAAIGDPTTNVNGRGGIAGKSVEFDTFYSNTATADRLLRARVPLVVGVDYPGGSARDHFISVFQDKGGNIWAVDPWGKSDDYAFAELPRDFSFAKPVKADLNASDGLTTIPCPNPWTGYYREKTTKAALEVKILI